MKTTTAEEIVTTLPWPGTGILPEPVRDRIRELSLDLSKTVLMPCMEGFHGPAGPKDRLLEYAVTREYGHCKVDIKITVL